MSENCVCKLLLSETLIRNNGTEKQKKFLLVDMEMIIRSQSIIEKICPMLPLADRAHHAMDFSV
jgi:hypothetical protein